MSTVLVFDSGVGGLSIANAIMTKLPYVSIKYVSDNEAFPYGTQAEHELLARTLNVLKTAQPIIQAKVIVIACNTASTIVLPALRAEFSIPIVGVVPAIKPAAALSTTKTIGLLATPGTVSRPYTDQLITDFASHCEVIKFGSGRLVTMAEEKLRGIAVNPNELHELLAPLHLSKIDTAVLACTHFPLLTSELSESLPHIKHWVDSGDAIARRVSEFVEAGSSVSHTYYYTKEELAIHQLEPALRERQFSAFNLIQMQQKV